MTRLPTPNGDTEYSAREVKPAALLLQDLLRAHAVFLLHHGVSLDALFHRVTPRSRFTVLLARYWDIFLSSWSVLLHGNPVRDVLPGLRLAACGELGIGVGEEERGSGEREVLEGLVEHTDGLVDLVVCKYGDLPIEETVDGIGADHGDGDDGHHDGNTDGGSGSSEGARWLGTGNGLGSEDGAIFLGVGALSRPALRNLTYWMEDVYSWGQDAYGIADNPSAPSRQTKHRKKASPAMGSISEQLQQKQQKKKQEQQQQQQQQAMAPPPSLLPPPPVTQLAWRAKPLPSTPTKAQPIPTPNASPSSSSQAGKTTHAGETPSSSLSESASGGAMDKYMSIMKLGYGTYWTLGAGSGDASSDDPASSSSGAPKAGGGGRRSRFRNASRSGQFLVPLVDEADEAEVKKTSSMDDNSFPVAEDTAKTTNPKDTPKPSPPKTAPRTIFVEMARANNSRPLSQNTIRDTQENNTDNAQGKGKDAISLSQKTVQNVPDASTTFQASSKLRVVVYAQQPFLYTFLFEQNPADGPASAEESGGAPSANEKIVQTLIDRQLSVLHKPLLNSTAYRPDKPGVAGAAAMLNATAAASPSSPLSLSPSSSSSPSASGSIYDLIWDPGMLTIHSTIPNIPDPYTTTMMLMTKAENSKQGKRSSKKDTAKQNQQQQQQQQPPWSRVEALNTHMQILNMYAATRSNGAELERMSKTSRGWWIVWNRIVDRSSSSNGGGVPGGKSKYGSTLFEEDEEEDGGGVGGSVDGGGDDDDESYQRAPSDCDDSDDTAALGTYTVRKEIILIRKASDHADNSGSGGGGSGGGSSTGGGLSLGMGRASSAMRAFSASAYLGFGGGSGSGAVRGSGDAAAAEVAAAVSDRGVGWADGASRLAQGIGVDTKKYIEGLLTLNK